MSMNIFNKIKETIMNIFNRFGISGVEGITDYTKSITPELQEKLNLWLDMAQGRAPWNADNKPCGVIPALIGAIADPVSEEIRIDSKNERLKEIMQELHARASENVGNVETCGGSLLRPIYSNNKTQFELIKQGFYLPMRRDFDGTLTGAVIMKKIQDGKKSFLLCEVHDFKNKTHSVKLDLYLIDGGNFYKRDLSACSQTAEMTENYKWENIEKPFIIEFKNPRPNDIDFSNNGIAIYGGHENLIADCDRQYNEINWEQVAGRTTIFADEDMFKNRQNARNGSDKVILNPELSRVVVQLHGNGTAEEKLYTHSPTLRTEQQIAAFEQILREIESATRTGRGTLSNLQEAPQTATQYKGGKQVLYNTVNATETEFEHKYKHAAYVFAYMLSAYEGVKFDPEITITYDESDRKDASMQRQEDLQEVTAGIMNKWEYRMKHYGETEEEAKNNAPEEVGGGFVM